MVRIRTMIPRPAAAIFTALLVLLTSSTCLCAAAQPEILRHGSSCCGSPSTPSPKNSGQPAHQCLHCQGALTMTHDPNITFDHALPALITDAPRPSLAISPFFASRLEINRHFSKPCTTLLRLHCALTI